MPRRARERRRGTGPQQRIERDTRPGLAGCLRRSRRGTPQRRLASAGQVRARRVRRQAPSHWVTISASTLGSVKEPTLRRILAASTFSLCVGVLIITLLRGLSVEYPMRLIQGLMSGVGAIGTRRRRLRADHHPAGRLPPPRRRGGVRAARPAAPSGSRATTSPPSPTRASSWSSTRTTRRTSRSSCATRSTTCPTCCAPRSTATSPS